jgi:TRAP transporter TAXI family solute receptor
MFGVRGAILASAILLSAAPASAQSGQNLTFATGRQGGYQYPITVALAQVMEKVPGVARITLQPGGGTGNVIAVGMGKAALGITYTPDTRLGIEGQAPYKQKLPSLVQLFALNPSKAVVIVPQDSPVKAFKDLAGKKVNSGPVGFSITTLSRKVYAMAGIAKKVDESHLEVSDAVEQFKDGHLDALFYAPSDWYAPYVDLSLSRKIRLVPLPEEVIEKLLKEEPGYYRTKFPVQKDLYKGLSNQVETIGYFTNIIANKDKIDDQLAYNLTKAVAENWEKVQGSEPSLKLLEPKDLALQAGVPIHPGSLRYFKERGWVK